MFKQFYHTFDFISSAYPTRFVKCQEATPGPQFRRAVPSALKIDRHVQTDLLFKKDTVYFLIENKLIHQGKEDNIKNSLVQVIEYLNIYRVDAAILLIFDAGKGKDREWDGHPENTLINCLTSNYPLCVVRIRKEEEYETRVYYQ